MGFLPAGYVKPVTKSNYLKFEEGDNRFRIISPAIVGWLDWTPDKKPVRTREEQRPLQDKRPKHFWAFIVWDYKSQQIKILELTQKTIQTSIYELHMDNNWGDPKGYDINVKKKGEKLDSEYTVVPTPPTPITDQIKMAFGKLTIDLNKLFEGEDPFLESKGKNTSGEIDSDSTDTVNVEDINFTESNSTSSYGL